MATMLPKVLEIERHQLADYARVDYAITKGEDDVAALEELCLGPNELRREASVVRDRTVLAVALAAAASHGLDLLSGCCPLGSLGLREASIPFRCISNAIICDLRRRMSSIRRSSLISITLGLLTVTLSFVRFT